jgi:predicted P-loop ATPase
LRQGFGSAETYKKVRGRLIAEIGEMKIMKSGQDVETIKSFVSAKVATVDIKYVESQRDIPLTASYFGTSNTIECLFDDTGNRRWWIVRLADIDKKLIAEKRDLPMRLHAYYTRLTMPMSMEEIFKAQTASAELDNFMGKLRDQAMITYSDYEVCLKVIRAWKNDNPQGGELQQSDIEKSAYGSGYTTRISQKSFRKAIKDAGFKQERRYDDNVGRAPLAWTWSPAGKQQELDPIPF